VKKSVVVLFVTLCVFLCFGVTQVYSEVLRDKKVLELIKNAPGPVNYPGLPAVYLLMEEDDFVNEDGTATYMMHVVWKILDTQAIPLGEVSIPFDSTISTLDIEVARTIKPDNTVINVEKENIRELSPYTNFPLYSNIRLKQFSMPAMEIGNIIEYKATLKLSKPKMPGLFYSYWSFPPGLPVTLSIFRVNVPKGIDVKYNVKNIDTNPEVSIEKGRKIYEWTVKDLFIEGVFEQFLPPYDIACPNLTFTTAKKWDEVAEWFYGLSEPQTEADEEMKAFVKKIVESKGGDGQKAAKELYNFVSQSIRYVAIPLKTSNYQPHKASEVYKNKYGDCKDKSALLISLYKTLGIDARFALLKTRHAGPLIEEFPALDFNHCIVAVPRKSEGYIFLDPTLELNRFGYMTTDMQNVSIFVVNEDGYEFVKLPIERDNISGIKVETEMKIGDDYVIEVNEKNIFFGEEEISARMNTKYATQDAIWAFFEKVAQSIYASAKLKDIHISNPSDLSKHFSVNLKYDVKDHIKEAGDLLIFDLPSGQMNVIVSAEKRTHPMWLPALNKTSSIITIIIPSNCKIHHLPADVEKDTPFGRYKREVSADRNKITIENHFSTKMLEIPADMYRDYKKFIEYIAKATKESIILKKEG